MRTPKTVVIAGAGLAGAKAVHAANFYDEHAIELRSGTTRGSRERPAASRPRPAAVARATVPLVGRPAAALAMPEILQAWS